MPEAKGLTVKQMKILDVLQIGQQEIASIGDLVDEDLQELVEAGYIGIFRGADGTARVMITNEGKESLG